MESNCQIREFMCVILHFDKSNIVLVGSRKRLVAGVVPNVEYVSLNVKTI